MTISSTTPARRRAAFIGAAAFFCLCVAVLSLIPYTRVNPPTAPTPAEPGVEALTYSGVSIRLQDLIFLAGKSGNEAVEAIREKGVIVLVIPSKRRPPFEPRAITIGNPADQQDAAARYERVLKKAAWAKGASGVFFAPFSTVSEGALPFADRSVIVVRRGLPVHALYHEYLHYLIYKARGPGQIVEQNGQRIYVWNFRWNRYQDRVAEVFDPKRLEELKRQGLFASRALEYFAMRFEIERKFLGEEMDATRTLVKWRREMGLSDSDVLGQLAYHYDNASLHADELESGAASLQELRDVLGQELAADDPRLQEVDAEASRASAAFQDHAQWIEAEMKRLAPKAAE